MTDFSEPFVEFDVEAGRLLARAGDDSIRDHDDDRVGADVPLARDRCVLEAGVGRWPMRGSTASLQRS
jgi:hypothetical protein